MGASGLIMEQPKLLRCNYDDYDQNDYYNPSFMVIMTIMISTMIMTITMTIIFTEDKQPKLYGDRHISG